MRNQSEEQAEAEQEAAIPGHRTTELSGTSDDMPDRGIANGRRNGGRNDKWGPPFRAIGRAAGCGCGQNSVEVYISERV